MRRAGGSRGGGRWTRGTSVTGEQDIWPWHGRRTDASRLQIRGERSERRGCWKRRNDEVEDEEKEEQEEEKRETQRELVML